MLKKTFGLFLGLLMVLALPSAASATSIQFSLNQSGGTLGTGPWGTVVLTQTAVDHVIVSVLLNAGNGFVDTGSGNHPDFAFSLVSGLVITAANITLLEDGLDPAGDPTGPWQWVFSGAVTTSNNLGMFGYSYLCSDPLPAGSTSQRCGNGAGNPDPGPLVFRISKQGIGLDSFGPSTGPVEAYFAADILSGQTGGTGLTGLVWATGPGVTIDDFCTFNCTNDVPMPEPASMMLLGTGLAGLAYAARRRRRS